MLQSCKRDYPIYVDPSADLELCHHDCVILAFPQLQRLYTVFSRYYLGIGLFFCYCIATTYATDLL